MAAEFVQQVYISRIVGGQARVVEILTEIAEKIQDGTVVLAIPENQCEVDQETLDAFRALGNFENVPTPAFNAAVKAVIAFTSRIQTKLSPELVANSGILMPSDAFTRAVERTMEPMMVQLQEIARILDERLPRPPTQT